jgi:hypothetical protein
LAFGLYAGGGALGMPAISGFTNSPQKQFFPAKEAAKLGKKY